NAQQVTHFEWFLDIDQGFGENHVQALSAGQNITADVTINIPAGTPAGYHKLYFRTKDSNGLWSHTVRRNINVVESQGELTVAQIEYFFGSDPQFGNASSYVVANPQA